MSTNIQLYTKEVSNGGKVSYVPYIQPTQKVSMYLSDNQVLTLASTIAVCCLIGLEQHLPAHKALSRNIREVETAIGKLAKLAQGKLDDQLVSIGTQAWDKTMEYISERVQ